MDWTPVLAIGSLITAFFTVWRWGIDPYLERKKRERSEKKKELEAKIQGLISCKNSIDFSIRNRVLSNEVDKYSCDVFSYKIPQEFYAKTEEYIENYQRLQDWLRASRLAVKYEIETHVKSDLPTTRKEYHLDSVLEGDQIMPFFLGEQRVNKRWIEENHPKVYKDIIKHLKEEETKLDEFFLNLNRALENNNVLKRFRKEKKALVEFGKKLMEELDSEIHRLQGEVD